MIEVSNITYKTVPAIEEMHFTNGIRGYRTNEGWHIRPLLREGEIKEFGPIPDSDIGEVSRNLGVILLGINEITLDNPYLSSQVWRSMTMKSPSQFSPADRWGSISNHARIASDDDYANLARNVAISLHAADIRLRDASDAYHQQLLSALASGTPVNRRFTNISLSDLHLAFHSLLAEMGAARDYLSTIVAMHVSAPKKIDSLARLVEWAKKPINAHSLEHEQISPLIEGWENDRVDRWLFEMGEYRNTFLHREPMGAKGIEQGVMISSDETSFGLIHKLRLDIPSQKTEEGLIEAFDRFVHLYSRLQKLADQIATSANYSSSPIEVKAKC